MRRYDIPQKELTPMWLKASEIENPVQVFSGFFQLHTLTNSRFFLWEMFNTALKNTQDWQQSQMSASEMTSFTTSLMSLIEAAELVSQANDRAAPVKQHAMVHSGDAAATPSGKHSVARNGNYVVEEPGGHTVTAVDAVTAAAEIKPAEVQTAASRALTDKPAAIHANSSPEPTIKSVAVQAINAPALANKSETVQVSSSLTSGAKPATIQAINVPAPAIKHAGMRAISSPGASSNHCIKKTSRYSERLSHLMEQKISVKIVEKEIAEKERSSTLKQLEPTRPNSEFSKEAVAFELNAYIKIIQERMEVEKIFLIETYGSVEDSKLEIDLLVLINDKQVGRIEKLENEVNTILRDGSQSYVTILKIGVADSLIRNGAPYLSYLCSPERKVFDAGRYDAFNAQNDYPVMDLALIADAHDSLMKISLDYLNSAKVYYEKGLYDLSAFMLFQATECSLSAIWDPLFPDHVRVRNLNKLFRGVRVLKPAIYNVFPRNNKEEVMIFQRLQRAYVHARYKTGYIIGSVQTSVLIDRVEKLQTIIKNSFVEIAANCLKGYPTLA